ncbi:MAG: putative selenate reductase subunit YgfK [Candidatus Neomarinimicrobiota bacterium]
MSDRLYPLSLRSLLQWILTEYESGSIFGIPLDLFYIPNKNANHQTIRYGKILDTPVGVAAGPHTQLSHNIVASYLCGARYIELKTVQTLDEIEVSKPCIDMGDEGYNCEWSQELKTYQSFNEYLNAWILIHILKDKLGWSLHNEDGFIFNLSVGYDYNGLLQPNVQDFLDKMSNCEPELSEKVNEISDLYPNLSNITIPTLISNNITLSTMHGCPPEEIEKIGRYLIQKRKFDTAIKLNPTLLGPDRLREILNSKLGYRDIIVPDEAFEHDLKWERALPIIRNLQALADEVGVSFGLKLTNTLEVLNDASFLPENESMSYLSGRALHPISINLAAALQDTFQGQLDLSFSAGADCFNIVDILASNMQPVTVCSDLLKPGGYGRLSQYLDIIDNEFKQNGVNNLTELLHHKEIQKLDKKTPGFTYLKQYSIDVLNNPAYHKHNKHFSSIKTDRKLEAFDCIEAPCIGSCAIQQNIPEYMHQITEGNIDGAYEVILKTNPIPGITGHVCDHLCQQKCTRNNYDETLKIREIKRFASEHHSGKVKLSPKTSNGSKVAVIGGGPAGISCAYFLALEGFVVDIFEAKEMLGGMPGGAIPQFRLPNQTVTSDIELIKSMGVKIHVNHTVTKSDFTKIQKEFDFIFIGVGATENKQLKIPGISAPQVINPIDFLSKVRRGDSVNIGNRIAIIGGGNTAIDAARTAQRLVKDGGRVIILYRRTRKEMPADQDEIEDAIKEGIDLHELVSPIKVNLRNKEIESITCNQMRLGEPDVDGRKSTIPIPNSTIEIPVDTIIPAIGQKVVVDFLPGSTLLVDQKSFLTQIPNVFAGGDAIRGASTLIEATADGQKVAEKIIKSHLEIVESIPAPESQRRMSLTSYKINYSRREYSQFPKHDDDGNNLNFNVLHASVSLEIAHKEAQRCLYCDDVCSICVGVCPNFANLSFTAEPHKYTIQNFRANDDSVEILDQSSFSVSQTIQILNIGDFCNECGNCTTFCPTSGDPYKDKPTFYLTRESFKSEPTGYFLNGSEIHFKNEDYHAILRQDERELYYEDDLFTAKLDQNSGRIVKLISVKSSGQELNTKQAVKMAYLLKNVSKVAPFNSLNNTHRMD